MVVFNIMLSCFIPKAGMVLTPLSLIGVTAYLYLRTKPPRPIWLTLGVFVLLAVQDLGLSFISYGIYDTAEITWMHLFMFLGLIPSVILVLLNILENRQIRESEKIASLFLFPLLIIGWVYLFYDLGSPTFS